MRKKEMSRRRFLANTSIGAAALGGALPAARRVHAAAAGPALLGGAPLRTAPFPRWPIWGEADEKAVLPVLRSGVWSRANVVTEAETKFARLMGVERCLLTSSGTSALTTSLYG